MSKGPQILIFLLVLACPGILFADPVEMNVSPGLSSSEFVLTPQGNVELQTLDAEVDYDASNLEKPEIEIIGGDLAYFRPIAPGALSFGLSRTADDVDLQIVLNFNTKSFVPGNINHVNASGTPMPANNNQNPNDPASSSPSPGGDGSPNGSGGSMVTAATGSAGSATQQKNYGTTRVRTMERRTTIANAFPASDRSATLLTEDKSVLERFRKFAGESGLRAFISLFGPSGESRIAQDPAIALSDGKTTVTLTVRLRQKPAQSPDLALFDAKLVSVSKADDTTMVFTLLPRAGTWNAGLALATGTETIEFPLVVAPPVKIRGHVNEKNFLAALNQFISEQASTVQGGNNSYLYNYVFTANYLASAARASVKTALR